ncbi:unnamed protein product, partial [Allacma fusca]
TQETPSVFDAAWDVSSGN